MCFLFYSEVTQISSMLDIWICGNIYLNITGTIYIRLRLIKRFNI